MAPRSRGTVTEEPCTTVRQGNRLEITYEPHSHVRKVRRPDWGILFLFLTHSCLSVFLLVQGKLDVFELCFQDC